MDSQEQKRILFIEDDRPFGQKFCETLKGEGYYVVWQKEAKYGRDWGLHAWFDMVISDQRMPGESGDAFLSFLSGLEKVDPDKLDVSSEIYRAAQQTFSEPTDLRLRQLLREAKAHPCVRVILSGYAETDSIRAALEKGTIHKFISKTLGSDEILEIVRGLFDKNQGQSVVR